MKIYHFNAKFTKCLFNTSLENLYIPQMSEGSSKVCDWAHLSHFSNKLYQNLHFDIDQKY